MPINHKNQGLDNNHIIVWTKLVQLLTLKEETGLEDKLNIWLK